MKTTELNTANEIRALSNQDLDAVAGGFVTYHGGGGGKVIGGGDFAQKAGLDVIRTIAGIVIIGGLFGL
jgi:hypothetical protein